jgi:hypothetical protein
LRLCEKHKITQRRKERKARENNELKNDKMKSTYQLLLFAFLFLTIPTFAQQEVVSENPTKSDSSLFKSDDYIAKKGYNLAPLPEFMIDPFIGLYLGIYSTIFDYGDGKIYPNYYQSLTIAAAYGTKGKTNFGLEYLNYGKFLLSAKINHTKSTMYPFYGFNGYQTIYNQAFHDATSVDYITSPFYNYQQVVNRLQVYIQDTLKGSFFNWQVGIDFGHYASSQVNFSKLNKGVDEAEAAPVVPTLYDRYVDWGIIKENEKNGGWANSVRAALVFDNRDRLTNPMHGMWTDITFRATPSFFGNPTSGVQLAITHRHYITLIKEKLSFAYRLRYDATFGNLPFYTRQVLADGTEGFGGTGTLWGIHQNRIAANQFAMGNFELRAKLVRFKFIKQNWYLGAVPLFHTGYLIDPIKMDLSKVTAADKEKFFSVTDKRWYSAYGIGLKLVMNENTVIGFDWAHSINNQAGNDAVYIGYGYTF